MNLLTLDSSVFISAFNKRDTLHNETREFFEYLKKKDFQIVVPTLVILEVGNALIREGKLRNMDTLLESFNDFEVVEMGSDFLFEALAIFKRFNLKTGDAIIVATALIHDTTLITWDRQIIHQAKSELRALTPKQYMQR